MTWYVALNSASEVYSLRQRQVVAIIDSAAENINYAHMIRGTVYCSKFGFRVEDGENQKNLS